jgi:hypothetical protein
MRKTSMIACLLMLLSTLSGCAWFSGDANPGIELASVANPRLVDLPVPKGFTFDAENSYTGQSAVIRRVDHLYTGPASVFAVARFYKAVMVDKEWRLVREIFSLNAQDLRFEKPGENCRVRITPGTWLHPTKLRLELWTTEATNRPATVQ